VNLVDFSTKNRNIWGSFKNLEGKSTFYGKFVVAKFDQSEPFRSICVTYGHLLIRKLQTINESSVVAVVATATTEQTVAVISVSQNK
jgi:hypothetical protein